MIKWEKIDIGTHITSDMTSFHVNIPHFMYMETEDKLDKVEDCDDVYYKNFNELCDKMINGVIDEKYLIEKNQVIPFVFSVREMAKLNTVLNNTKQIEYLRFYPYNGMYVVTNDGTPIEWKNLMRKTL